MMHLTTSNHRPNFYLYLRCISLEKNNVVELWYGYGMAMVWLWHGYGLWTHNLSSQFLGRVMAGASRLLDKV